MKTIQIILYSYFLIKGLKNINSSIEKIEFISPMNKLKVYNGPLIECKLKSKYSRRKYYAIQHTKYFIQNYKNYLDYFNKIKKKDDLADSFLQGLFYIKKNKLNSE